MIKDVLVHLDGSPEDECRLAYAAMVGRFGRTSQRPVRQYPSGLDDCHAH
jgi:hypothetical protein